MFYIFTKKTTFVTVKYHKTHFEVHVIAALPLVLVEKAYRLLGETIAVDRPFI